MNLKKFNHVHKNFEELLKVPYGSRKPGWKTLSYSLKRGVLQGLAGMIPFPSKKGVLKLGFPLLGQIRKL